MQPSARPTRPPLPGARVNCPTCGQSAYHVRVPTDAEMLGAGTVVALLYGRCTGLLRRVASHAGRADTACDTWFRVVCRVGRAPEVARIDGQPGQPGTRAA